jgi:hypothetical protein
MWAPRAWPIWSGHWRSGATVPKIRSPAWHFLDRWGRSGLAHGLGDWGFTASTELADTGRAPHFLIGSHRYYRRGERRE